MEGALTQDRRPRPAGPCARAPSARPRQESATICSVTAALPQDGLRGTLQGLGVAQWEQQEDRRGAASGPAAQRPLPGPGSVPGQCSGQMTWAPPFSLPRSHSCQGLRLSLETHFVVQSALSSVWRPVQAG